MRLLRVASVSITAALLSGGALAQPAAQVESPAPAGQAKEGAAPSLVVLFESGSSTLTAQDLGVLDKASRAYSEGKPIVMILTGSSDRVGNPKDNLSLSQRRATSVLKGLLDRGIPADRFQVLAKGQTDLPVPTEPGIAEKQNRRVEISWH